MATAPESAPATNHFPDAPPTLLRRSIGFYFHRWWMPPVGFFAAIVFALGFPPLLGFAVHHLAKLWGPPGALNPYQAEWLVIGCGIVPLAGLGGWGIAIIAWFIRRRWKRAIIQTVALPATLGKLAPVVLIAAFVLAAFANPMAYDRVYSPRQGKWYILASEPVPTDTCYQVLGAKRLWSPIWTQEFAEGLDYSEDGSLTENPHLILSQDETILVIARGGQKTDAMDLESGAVLTKGIPWTLPDREEQWRARTAQIDDLLAAAAGPAAALQIVLARVLAPLGDEYEEKMRAVLGDSAATVECRLKKVEDNEVYQRVGRGTVTVTFTVNLQAGAIRSFDFRELTLFIDGDAVRVLSADSDLMWSSDTDEITPITRAWAEQSRDIFGTFVGRTFTLQ